MQYTGGKTKIARYLTAEIAARAPQGRWWEPFCGGLSMSVALTERFGRGLVSDGNAALVALYRAVGAGWTPPEAVSPEEYQAARQLPDQDPLKAFCAVGCSFGGKWFGGYASNARKDDYCGASRRALLRDVPIVGTPHRIDFLAEKPCSGLAFLYLDPPYRGTLGYAGAPPFDHDAFVTKVEEWSCFAHVFVSEYTFPLGQCIFEKCRRMTTAATSNTRTATERLFWLPRKS